MMHYLSPLHEVLSDTEAAAELDSLSLSLDELPNILYLDAALRNLRAQGQETPVGAVVRIHRVRPRLSDEDFRNPDLRTKQVYRRISEV